MSVDRPFGPGGYGFTESLHPRNSNGTFAEKAQADPGIALLNASVDEVEADAYPDQGTSNYLPIPTRRGLCPFCHTPYLIVGGEPVCMCRDSAGSDRAARNPFLTGDKCPICEAPFDMDGGERGCRCYNSPGSVERRAGALNDPDRNQPSGLRRAKVALGAETGVAATAATVIAGIPIYATIAGTASAAAVGGYSVSAALAVAVIGGMWWAGVQNYRKWRDQHRANVAWARRNELGRKLSHTSQDSLTATLAAARTEYLATCDADGRMEQFPDGWLDSTKSPGWTAKRVAAEAEWRRQPPAARTTVDGTNEGSR